MTAPTEKTARPSRPVPLASPAGRPLRGAEAEREIARLTWAVLDGRATLADRNRLGELVKVQHAARRQPA